MAQYGPGTITAELNKFGYFGIDAYQVPSPASQPLYPLPYRQYNPLGIKVWDNTPTLAFPWGQNTAYRYVRYIDSTATAITATGPFPVYWADTSYTTVTPIAASGIYNGANNVAGYAMPNLTALTQYTSGSQLATALIGNLCWMAVAGYLAGVMGASTTAVGDAQIGLTGSYFVPGKTAANASMTNRVLGFADTAISSSLINVFITIESL